MDRLSPGIAAVRSACCRRGCSRLLDLLVRWRLRALGRRQLQQLDSRALGDLGLNLADQRREGGKPFWRE